MKERIYLEDKEDKLPWKQTREFDAFRRLWIGFFLISIALMFIPSSDAYICYQESANVSTTCGGLNTGVYDLTNTSATASNSYKWQYIYNGNWNDGFVPYPVAPGTATFLVNYTVPTNTSVAYWDIYAGTASWTVYYGTNTGGQGRNLSIYLPSSCFNSGKLILKDFMDKNLEDSTLYCYNTSNTWMTLAYADNDNLPDITEEAIRWEINNFTIRNVNYTQSVYESTNSMFKINLTYDSSYYGLTAYLVYNGTSYLATVNGSGNNVEYYNLLNIPQINSAQRNQSFYWNLSFIPLAGGQSVIYNSTTYNQTVNGIGFSLCGAYPSNVKYLNFTIYNESNNVQINTTFQADFEYSATSGDNQVSKNYSINLNTVNSSNYAFCYYPNNTNVTIVHANILYDADGYAPNNYVLDNATLSNVTTYIPLYILSDALATKFYITFRENALILQNSIVNIAKEFIGNNSYTTTSVSETDSSGKIVTYLEVDKNYRFLVIRNGEAVGIVDRKASCLAQPCTLDINIDESNNNIFDGYYDLYSQNVLSNVSFNSTDKIVTYRFLDTTGLAHYFRLVVTQAKFSGVSVTVCDSYSYSSFGSITCNMTNYDGDFFAYGYISRSPEKLDQVLSFIIDTQTIEDLGIFSILLTLALVSTFVFAIAVISRGSPSAVIFALGVVIIFLKILHIFPFSWTVTVTLEALFFYVLMRMKT